MVGLMQHKNTVEKLAFGFSTAWVICNTVVCGAFLPAMADTKGITIRQDSDKNVNVMIDPVLMPNAQIKRRDNAMVIVIPESQLGGNRNNLQIDPDLKRSVTINSTDTHSEGGDDGEKKEKKAVITIHSQNIQLNVQKSPDLSPVFLESPNKQAATRKDKPAVPPAKAAAPLPVTTLVKAAPPVAVTPTKPKGEPTAVAAPVKPVSPAPAARKVPAINYLAVESEPHPPQTPPKKNGEGPFSKQRLEKILAQSEIQNQPQEPQPQEPQPAPPPSKTETPPPEPDLSEGTQGRPLAELVQQQPLPVTADGTIPRIVISLIAVLAILFSTLKFGLPKLFAAFPGLENRLKTKRSGYPTTDTTLSKGMASLIKRQFPEIQKHHPNEEFAVRKNLSLGEGKSLHLVEIYGRKLVIGATPHQISLITELTEDDQDFPEEFPEEFLPENKTPSNFIEEHDEIHPKLGNYTEAYIAPQKPTKPAPESTAQAPFQKLSKIFSTPPQRTIREPQRPQAYEEYHEGVVEAEAVEVLHDYDDHYKA